jgi:hypothetical protein
LQKMPSTLIVENCKRFSRVLVVIQVLGCPLILRGTDTPSVQNMFQPPSKGEPACTLVVGFVGGLVQSNDLRHSEVQIARQLQTTYGHAIQVEVFRNQQRIHAHRLVVAWFNAVSQRIEPKPRIILFGHSWGASAVVYLARELARDGIPVALTIQVDSVRKNGQDDSVIPANVALAVNFYQSKGIVHGCPRIIAADPVRTAVLGNFQFEYKNEPPQCHAYPWYDRLLFKGHTSIECDPRVWSQVGSLIETHLAPLRPPTASEVAARILK